MTFTDKKPTVPGAYWYAQKPGFEILVSVQKVDGILICAVDGNVLVVSEMDGLWSSRLVPVEEVKEAYHEGVGSGAAAGKPLYVGNLWSASRARRVVEGKDGV